MVLSLYICISIFRDVNMIRRRIKWLADHPWLLALVFVLVIATGPVIAFTIYNNDHAKLLDCLSSWADEYSNRSSIVAKATNDLRDSEDKVIRAAARGDRKAIIEELGNYVIYSDKLKQVLKDHPIPETPKLRCE